MKAVRNIKGNGLQGAYLPLRDPPKLMGCTVPALLLPCSVSFYYPDALGKQKEEQEVTFQLIEITSVQFSFSFSSGLHLHSHRDFTDLNKSEVTRVSFSQVFAGPLGLPYKGSALLF